MRIIAHRGDSAHAPENTRAAIRLALAGGADGAEIDVRLTADSHPVLLHDAKLARTTSLTGPVSRTTWQDLQHADAGSWFDPAFNGERVARLSEVLAEWPAKRRLFIELKDGSRLLAPLRAVLAAHAGKELVLLGFDADLMHAAAREVPGWPIFVNVEAPLLRREDWFDRQLARAAASGWRGLSIGVASGWSSAWPARLHELGLGCAVWTVDDAERAKQLRDDGVDDLMTNDPALIGARLR